MDAVDLGPDVILRVPDPPHSAADGAAEHGEAVGPLADAALAGLQQDEGVVVAREALEGLAELVVALVQLDSAGAAGALVG